MTLTRTLMRSILNQPKLPSRHIPGHIKDQVTGQLTEASPLKFLWQYRKGSIRRRYATFGKDSGLKAGICWPTREELQFKQEYEAKFEKTVEEMREKLAEKKKQEAEKRVLREREIVKNLKKLPQMKKEFWANYHKLHEDIRLEKESKEKLIQEVREYLGYDIEPTDPRFEEAIAKKDEEEKSALRAARKLERQRQHMEMLQALVSEALEKEKQDVSKKSAEPKTDAKQAS